jgi:hypothetical protein
MSSQVIPPESATRLGDIICQTVGLKPGDVATWTAESGRVEGQVLLTFELCIPNEQFKAILEAAGLDEKRLR